MTERGDRGSIAPLVPIIMFALLLLGGLVVDGSRTLNARGNAQAFAEEAARAGASATRNDTPGLMLDDTLARTRVAAYCRAIRSATHADVTVTHCALAEHAFTPPAVATCDGSRPDIVVNMKITVQIDTTLLGLIGIEHFSASGQASARPYEGVNGANRC